MRAVPATAVAALALGALMTLPTAGASARNAYVANRGSKSVSVFDTRTNQDVGSPIPVGELPEAIAITPDGRRAYVTNALGSSVSVIDTLTNQVVGSPIVDIELPDGIAITPDGRTAYVTNFFGNSVSVIDTQTNEVVGSPITVGSEPEEVAITPNGLVAYVANSNSKSVSVIDTQTNQVVGPAIKVGKEPGSIAITPDGRLAYVVNNGSGDISVIDTQANQVVGPPIKIHVGAIGIAITPDGKTAYVTETGPSGVTPISTQTGIPGPAIGVGTSPFGIAIVPDQSPVASFTTARARPDVPLVLDASPSTDSDGTIATYAWNFGDGQMAAGGPRFIHTYRKPGAYQATLTLTDNEGCSTSLIFTGQTAYCNGSASATQTQTLRVSYPGVRVRCPRSARPRVCHYKLQAVSKKRRGKSESAVATGKAKAGKSAIVSLVPNAKFRSKLAGARKVLVRETVKIGGSRRTSYRKLKIVR